MSRLGSPRVLWSAAALGALGVVLTFVVSGPARFFLNWVLWFVFLVSVGLGALFVVALEHLVGSHWSIPLRRVPERIASLLLPAVPVGLVALLAMPVLYPWSHAEAAQNPFVAGKLVWLNTGFVGFRTVLFLVLWAGAYVFFCGGSLKQDASHDPAFTVKARRWSPAFMVVFAFSLTILAFDWISSLEPEWYSDIFGVYLFAGTFLCGLAATGLAVVALKNRGRLEGVRQDHLYNVGGYIFAFTVFWSYIAFAQYMLMWYANMPEEVFWYADRIHGPWLPVALLLAAIHFVGPFFLLIARKAKGELTFMKWVGLMVLAGHFLDLYWLIVPSGKMGILAGWQEASFALFFLSGGVLWMRRAMARGEDMPVGDPFLTEGLAFRMH